MLSSLDSFQAMAYPEIIQGGMGAGVSNWRLANAVARLGQLGVVSGTALDTIQNYSFLYYNFKYALSVFCIFRSLCKEKKQT